MNAHSTQLDYLPDAWVLFAETLGFFLPDIYRLLEQYRPIKRLFMLLYSISFLVL